MCALFGRVNGKEMNCPKALQITALNVSDREREWLEYMRAHQGILIDLCRAFAIPKELIERTKTDEDRICRANSARL